jgi:hypothetical protein
MTITLSVYKETRKPQDSCGPFTIMHPLHEQAHGTHYVCRVIIETDQDRRLSELSGSGLPALAGAIESDIAAGKRRINALPSELRFQFDHECKSATRMLCSADERVHLDVERAPLDGEERTGFIRALQRLVESLAPSPGPATLPVAAAIVLV